MDANLLKYLAFVRAVECGSFTKAAETLSYSQSAVSRMIRDLELECGLVLLERSRAGVRLTAEGVKLLPYAKALCEQYRLFQDEADALSNLHAGLIRIGTISSIAALTKFLINLGVDEITAEADACKMEHDLSEQSYRAICAHADRHGEA